MNSSIAKPLVCVATALWALSGACQPTTSHAVKPGETLWDIARRHLNSPQRWIELQKRNGVAIPELLQPGRILRLATPAPPLNISVVELSGLAWVTPANGEQRALQLGAPVHRGDILVTEPESFLCLGLSDGSRMVLPSSSAIRLVESVSRGIQFELLAGRVESYITKQHSRGFEVRTRTAGVGVQGTHFRVRDEAGLSAAEVLEGRVRVHSMGSGDGPDRLSLPQGRGALLGRGPLTAQELLPAAASVDSNSEQSTVSAVPVHGGASYRLQLARDERLLHLVFETRSDLPSFQLPELPVGFYHSRVTAIDTSGLEGFPADTPVYVRQGLKQEARASVGADRSVLLTWPALGNQAYVVEVSLDSEFRIVVATARVAGGRAIVGPFPGDGLYHWRVRSQASAVANGSFHVPDK